MTSPIKTIKTIKRTKDMPIGARYQATDLNGATWYYRSEPTCPANRAWWCGPSVGYPTPGGKIVGGWRRTLRRIVDPPKKPKRKTTLAADNKRLRDVLRRLRDACMNADADGELSEHVDGALLNQATIALIGRDGGVRWPSATPAAKED